MWPCLLTETWVAITLHKFTMPTRLWHIGHLFGVGKVTSREAILEVCGTFQDVLGHTMLQVKDPLEVVVGF